MIGGNLVTIPTKPNLQLQSSMRRQLGVAMRYGGCKSWIMRH
jgi:hypothetical protein